MKKKTLLKSLLAGFLPAAIVVPATITSCASDREYPDFYLEKTTERFTNYLNFSYTIIKDAGEQSTVTNVYFVYNNGINVDFVYLSPVEKPSGEGNKMKVTFEIDHPHNMVNTGIHGMIQISGTRPSGHDYTKRFSVMLYPHDDFEVSEIFAKAGGEPNRVEIIIKSARELTSDNKLNVSRCTISDRWGGIAQIQSMSAEDAKTCRFVMIASGEIDNDLDEKYGRFNMLYGWDKEETLQNVSLVGVGGHLNPNI